MKTLGIDLGTNSMGWCLIETDGEPCLKGRGEILVIGTRIFSQSDMAGRDAKSKESLAVARRNARSASRRRDRYLSRRAALLRTLTSYGLMPESKDARAALLKQTGDGKNGDMTRSVYGLRARALDEKLAPHEIGRVLFQLNQRRGFKSNRKTDKGDNEAGKIATGVARLHQAMQQEGAQTLGQFLHQRRVNGLPVRTRLGSDTGPDGKGQGYAFYPSRADLEDEFNAICATQTEWHPDLLTEDRIDHLRAIIFHQRPLKAPRVGKCAYNELEERLPKAHPLFQAFRLYKEINELEIIDPEQHRHKLTPDQRDALILKLRSSKTATFPALRKVLKLGPEYSFNKQTRARKHLTGDEVYAALSQREAYGPRWTTLSVDEQWAVIEKLMHEEDALKLRAWLEKEHDLAPDQAQTVSSLSLPVGYGRLGPTALAALLDDLIHATDGNGHVIPESRAAINVYGRTNAEDDPERLGFERLPPYQEVLARHIPPGSGDPNDPYDERMGRITNPTVHIALNQLRRVVNLLIKRHGKPDQISIELGRDLKLSDLQRQEVERSIAKNTSAAQERSAKLKELGVTDNGYNRMRLKLWEELNPDDPLNRVCVYSGEVILLRELFTDAVDVDHILPYSKTLDDSQANRIVCKAHANRQKANRAPAEVAQWRESYGRMLARASNLPRNKQWRFAEDAMDRFRDEEGFVARQLTDMQYLARLARIYLASLYDAEEADGDGVLRKRSHVRALPGRTTEMLRRHWNLNDLLADHNVTETAKKKNRLDHRHHAIDAFVIACTTRAMIQKIASASAKLESEGAERVVADAPEPWPTFRDELRAKLLRSVVSHKPDHGSVSRAGYAAGKGQTAGRLHNDTAYGLTGEVDDRGAQTVTHRKPITSFEKASDLEAVRDTTLREALQAATTGITDKKVFVAAVQALTRQSKLGGKPNPFFGLRRARILENLSVISISDAQGRPYKAFKGDSNHRFDVWRLADGKYVGEIVSSFDAHQPNWQSTVRQDNPTAKKVLSLQQNDMVALGEGKERRICRVVKFSANKQIALADHFESGALKSRDSDKQDPFRYVYKSPSSLVSAGGRQVQIDEIGRVFDAGSVLIRNS